MRKILIIVYLFSIFHIWGQSSEKTPPVDFYRAVIEGDIEIVKKNISMIEDLNKSHSYSSHYTSSKGTPIYNAIRYGHVVIADFLLNNGVVDTPDESTGTTLITNACNFNQVDIVEYLINRGYDPDETDKMGYSLLMKAVQNNREELVGLLISSEADLLKENLKGSNLFHFVASSQMCWLVDRLIELDVDINKRNSSGYTALEISIISNNSVMIDKLLSNGAKLEYNQKFFQLACRGDQIEIAKRCLKTGDVNATIEELRIAARCGSEKIAEFLLENGVPLINESPDNLSLLDLAALGGNNFLIKKLALNGADLNCLNDSGTPLHISIDSNHIKTIKLLIELGADIHIADGRGYSPFEKILNFYLEHPNTEIDLDLITLFIENGSKINVSKEQEYLYRTPIDIAVKIGDMKLIQYLLDEGAAFSIERSNFRFKNPVSRAVSQGNIELVYFFAEIMKDNSKILFNDALLESCSLNDCAMTEALLRIGADPNFVVEDSICYRPFGTSPMYIAVKNNIFIVQLLLDYGANIGPGHIRTASDYCNLDVIQLLIDNGVAVNVDGYDISLLHKIAYDGSAEVIQLLLDNGADINARTDIRSGSYSTPIFSAARRNTVDVIEVLLDAGADINDIDAYGDTPLHAAVSNNTLDVVQYLIDKGAYIYSKTDYGETPLHYAARENKLDILIFLLENGARSDINEKNKEGKTPYILAFSQGNDDRDEMVLEVLVSYGATVYDLDKGGNTKLHLIAESGSYDELFQLLNKEKDLDVNLRNGDHETPLHLAIEYNSIDIVRLLLDNGADMNADKSGYTPLYSAVGSENYEIIKLLLESGADPEYQAETGSDLHLDSLSGYINYINNPLISDLFNNHQVINWAREGVPSQDRNSLEDEIHHFLKYGSKEGLRYFRNAFFALIGYEFHSPELLDIFKHFSWYKPNSEVPAAINLLSENQQNLLQIIQEYEDEL